MAFQFDYRRVEGSKDMRIIYKLDENDIRKILADHFEALEDEVKIEHVTIGFEDRMETQTRIEIDTVQD